MSQSTKTTSNTKMCPGAQATTTTSTNTGIKRNLSVEFEQQTKKPMFTQSISSSSTVTKFITASQLVAANKSHSDVIPEISDEELLEMALMMEENK